MANIINLTSNQSDVLIGSTSAKAAGVSVMIGSDESIGSGTMSFGVLPQGEDLATTSFSVNYIDATLDAGHNQYYRVGGGMSLYVKLTGATSPDCDVIVTEVEGID